MLHHVTIAQDLPLSVLLDVNAPNTNEILELLLNAMSHSRQNDALAIACVKKASRLYLTTEVFPDRTGEKFSAGGLASWQIARVKGYIDRNIASQVSLEELANLVRLSTSYFAAAFKASFGVAPHGYIISRRVEWAKDRMRLTEMPLCEVALECGLSDQAHLSRIFKKATGMTPSAWRRQARAA